METRYQVVVHNRAHSGYRRAGFVLEKGQNLLMDVTDTQIAAFKADPRLVFGSQDLMPTETITEAEQRLLSESHQITPETSGLESDVLPADLDFTVDEIKTKLTALGIKYNSKAKKPELLELLAQAAESGQGGE
ncbi:HI1506-related protein [Testudinibacter sp. P27/CKL/0425]